jgi:predicted GIY-YIG superfamily endonuclease
MKPGFVYMLTNKPGGVLYIGVTDDLASASNSIVAGQTRGSRSPTIVMFWCGSDISIIFMTRDYQSTE